MLVTRFVFMAGVLPVVTALATAPIAALPAAAAVGSIQRLSVSSSGEQVVPDPLQAEDRGPLRLRSGPAAVSSGGRFTVFASNATSMVPDDGENARYGSVFLRDAVNGTTTRVQAGQGNAPSISADGRYVAFTSSNDMLELDDFNGKPDVFVRDLQTGKTTLASVSSTGRQGNEASHDPSISPDGRYVGFKSLASTFIDGNKAINWEAYVHDLVTGTTTWVSAPLDGQEMFHLGEGLITVSAGGRYVAFDSRSSNMVPGDKNQVSDVFVRDLVAGTTTRVSTSAAGEEGNRTSDYPEISADGRYVVFRSASSNLVSNITTTWKSHIYRRDLVTGAIDLISVSDTAEPANDSSQQPSISADGRRVAYGSLASNLVSGDTNQVSDVFVRDLVAGTTTRVSRSASGDQANRSSGSPKISADGSHVVFVSSASNLVPGDTNGSSDVFLSKLDM